MFPLNESGSGDDFLRDRFHAFGHELTERLEQRGEGDVVLVGEVAEPVTGRVGNPDVQVSPLVHRVYSYTSANSGERAATSWLQQPAGNGSIVRLHSQQQDSGFDAPRTPAIEDGEEDVVARPTGEEALRAFCRYQRKRNLSENTIKNRRFKLQALDRYLGDVDLLDATPRQIERWLRSTELAPQTFYTYVTQVAAFYAWAAKTRIIRRDPTEEIIRPKLPEAVPRPWNAAEVAGAIMLADDRMRCLLLLCWFAGARCMEIAALRVEEIYEGSILLHGKGNKERVVPLHPEVKRALTAYGLPRAGYVFRRKDGWPLKPGSISKYINIYLRSVGVKATAHQGRHRYGTDLYELSDGDLLMVAELMGHANIQTTKRYAAWAKTKANETVLRLALPSVMPEPAFAD